jgi:hypothetical protein
VATTPPPGAARAGLPDPSSVVHTGTLVRSPSAAAPGGLAAGATTYRILRTTEVDEYDAPVTPAEVAPLGPEAAPAAPVSDAFGGTARKAAKLSLSKAPAELVEDVAALLDTLESVAAMANKFAAGAVGPTSKRIKEENRNVTMRAFIYASSREADNDFHVIIGRDPEATPSVYMTIEVSGLPPASHASFAKLKGARDAFKNFFGGQLPGESYDFYDPPIPIDVTGSLFFDLSHANGARPGPKTLRPHMPTVWEIHPVSKLVFEP